jgi:hypothetical protein
MEIAAYLKGGVPSKDETEKTEAGLPTQWDSPDVRKAKTDNLKMLISARRAGQLDMLRNAGYDVANFDVPGHMPAVLPTSKNKSSVLSPPQAEAAVSGGAHPQDDEAIKWAKSNPRDPRAAAILKANGM